jgi:hypothetical protein
MIEIKKASSARSKNMTRAPQTLMEAKRLYHNYIKPHQGSDDKTPAEVSGIKRSKEKTSGWCLCVRRVLTTPKKHIFDSIILVW